MTVVQSDITESIISKRKSMSGNKFMLGIIGFVFVTVLAGSATAATTKTQEAENNATLKRYGELVGHGSYAAALIEAHQILRKTVIV